ncbi:MAG: ferrous iron transport protein B [Desulfuromonadales bacterium]|nr:ferrous iron transport protein B [Desulfuromonadales bacterium]MBN2791387.1 ferrous iron transport protein B [Desulfuromonadales bacterium]
MIRVALAGQPNCGKSTIFNLLAGVNQHVANYPGVTVDKKTAGVKFNDTRFEFVDLPGTYSFSTYSLEERVAKQFLMDEAPDVIVNIVDASCLRRSLYLTFQLLELGKPVVLVLNMMDIAERRNMTIDTAKLAEMLNVEVVTTIGSKRQGRRELFKAVQRAADQTILQPFRIDYGELELYISEAEELVRHDGDVPARWLAIKALESDDVVLKKTGTNREEIKDITSRIHDRHDLDVDQAIARLRYDNADVVYHKCVKEKKGNQETLTAKADRLILNRWLAFPILGGVIFLIYQLAIVWGYKLTDYTWPLLAAVKNKIVDLLPAATSIEVPLITDFSLWMINSVIALLNYIPIFFILFALIAILEDVGYMPRMAFILDRIFKRFGLHGQSTLPLVLGGALVGGCAVPGVMATKGIADARARLATILVVPYMNCLAKVPFYTLLLGAFFKQQMSMMMFFISTVTLFIALIVARLLTSTVLRSYETAPFVMELPTYHLPTFRGVVLRAFQRVWLYIKKVVTVVVAVAVVLFVLLQYPGVSDEKMAEFRQTADSAVAVFMKKAASTSYADAVDDSAEIFALISLYDSYKSNRMLAKSKEAVAALDAKFLAASPQLFPLIRPEDEAAEKLNREVRKLSKVNKKLQIEIKNEKISNSFLGMFGRAIEPVSRLAGFDWRINVAFLSSFAARESAVATLGSIYEKGKSDLSPEQAIAQDGAYTPLHATSMLIFMILTPPCIATMVVVKLQSNSTRWMLFATFFPITLGIVLSMLFFGLAVNFNWSGLDMMRNFYISVVALTFALGLIKTKRSGWQAGKTMKG